MLGNAVLGCPGQGARRWVVDPGHLAGEEREKKLLPSSVGVCQDARRVHKIVLVKPTEFLGGKSCHFCTDHNLPYRRSNVTALGVTLTAACGVAWRSAMRQGHPCARCGHTACAKSGFSQAECLLRRLFGQHKPHFCRSDCVCPQSRHYRAEVAATYRAPIQTPHCHFQIAVRLRCESGSRR